MDFTFPDSPEAVALALLDRALDQSEPERGSNKPPRHELIELYAQRLAAARGERSNAHLTLL